MKKILYLIPALLLFAACNKTAKEPASEGSDTPAIVNADGTIDEIGVETVATGNVENLNDVDFKIKVSSTLNYLAAEKIYAGAMLWSMTSLIVERVSCQVWAI